MTTTTKLDDTSACETEVTSEESIVTTTWQKLSAARSRAIGLVPELAKHEWRDTYFDSKSKHDIIAVFDHDPELLALTNKRLMDVFCKVSLPCFVFVLTLTAITDWHALPGTVGFISPIIALNLFTVYLIRRSTLAHTAVTSDGVLYIDKQRMLHCERCCLIIQP